MKENYSLSFCTFKENNIEKFSGQDMDLHFKPRTATHQLCQLFR
jgi:hypothetical protein